MAYYLFVIGSMAKSGWGLEPRSSRNERPREFLPPEISSASVEMENRELSVVKLSCDGDRSMRHETARIGVGGG